MNKTYCSVHSQRRFLLLLLYSALSFFLHAQKGHVSVEAFTARYRQADAYYNKALRLAAKKGGEQAEEQYNQLALQHFRALAPEADAASDSLRFFLHLKTGELEHYFYNAAAALNHYQKALAIKPPSLPVAALFKPYIYSGIIFYTQEKFDSALRCFNQAETIQARYAANLPEAERLYNNLGALYYETGNYRQAKNYFQKAAAVLLKTNPYYKSLFVYYNINIASSLIMLGEYEKAYQVCIGILPFGTNTAEIYHNIGNIQFNLGKHAEALRYFKKVTYASSRIIALYNDVANTYLSIGASDSANLYLQKAMAANRKYNAGRLNSAHGQTLKYAGDMELLRQNWSAALQYYQQAIRQFYPAYADTSVVNNPAVFSGVFSYINLFNALTAKAAAWHGLFKNRQRPGAAEAALDTYAAAFHLVDYVERTYDNDEARLFLDKTKYSVHAKPIELAFELYSKTGQHRYLEIAYQFDQQNKATILALNQQQNQLADAASSALVQQERNLKDRITRLALKAAQLTDAAAMEQSNTAIRDYEIQLGKVQDQLARRNATPKTIPAIIWLQQHLLDNHTAIISYHLAPEKLTTIVIQKDTAWGFQKPLAADFHTGVKRFITGLQTNTAAAPETRARAQQLYQLLIATFSKPHINRLIIIPDDELNYLPFEALQDESNTFLVQRCAVQYQYSTLLLKPAITDFKNKKTLAFAPFATGTHATPQQLFSALPFSGDEVAGVAGTVFSGAAATKDAFLKNASRYPVIHLATHAFVNDSADNLSYIAFAPRAVRDDYLLYAREIYNLPLQHNELVILSACETSNGNLVRGEGVMSLSRAFAYAGCSNIITSLWKANDESTAYLSRRLHAYLQKGLPVDKAMQQSKLDLLADSQVPPRLKQPFYWANLIFVGDYRQVTEPARNTIYVAIAGCALLLVLLVVWIRRKWPAKHSTNT